MPKADSWQKVNANITIALTKEDIDDIMCTALEGGISYWCRKAKVIGEHRGECASEEISRGNTIRLYDAESSDCWDLTLEKFLNGVKLFIESGFDCHLNLGRIDPSDIDAEGADAIIQFAVFGELVYG